MMPPTRFTRIYSSPHTRRYFRSCRSRSHTSSLFSAHAEVFPCSPRALTCRRPLLRTRGGISKRIRLMNRASFSSPHTRRYFHNLAGKVRQLLLFSAHAEVFPNKPAQSNAHSPLLRTRGGISGVENLAHLTHRSSPHTRRYFQQSQKDKPDSYLFSAHAEVFPNTSCLPSICCTLLRTRGGISASIASFIGLPSSSPHTRRYFP